MIEELVMVIDPPAVPLRFIALKFTKEYSPNLGNLGFLGATVIIPGFAATLTVERWAADRAYVLKPVFRHSSFGSAQEIESHKKGARNATFPGAMRDAQLYDG